MKTITLILIIMMSIFVNAQNNFEIIGSQKAVIPFRLINNLIFIDMKVNGVDLTFMLDTGVAETTLFSLENKNLQLSGLEKIKFTGLGGSTSIEGFKSDHNAAQIGKNFINSSFLIYIILDNDFNISSHVGIPVNGIIGYHFFKNHPIIIDYSTKKITIYQQGDFIKKTRNFKVFPITIEQYKPYIYAEVEMINEKKSSKLLIDLGNSDAIWLFPSLIPNFIYNRPHIEDFLGRGFNGDIFGKRSRIHQFILGDFNFVKPLVAMPDEYSIQHVKIVEGRKGSIGADLLRRFTIGLDYQNGKLFLRKNKSYNDPFHFNMSGLDFKQDGMFWEEDMVSLESKNINTSSNQYDIINNNLQYKFILKPIFSVAGVRKNSPADVAGLQKDDQIININGRKTSDMTLQKMIDLMKSEEGKKINIVILRKNKELTFQFLLEDPIPYSE